MRTNHIYLIFHYRERIQIAQMQRKKWKNNGELHIASIWSTKYENVWQICLKINPFLNLTFVGENSITTGSLRFWTLTPSIAAEIIAPATWWLPLLVFSAGNRMSSWNTMKLIRTSRNKCNNVHKGVLKKEEVWIKSRHRFRKLENNYRSQSLFNNIYHNQYSTHLT